MSHMSLEDMPSKSAVAQFYDNRSVFITGATGFMGKVYFNVGDDSKMAYRI